MKLENVDVSILIITRDRHSILGGCLDALYPQLDLTRHEVVVVDSSVINNTKDLISKYSWVNYFRISLPLGTRPQSYSFGAKHCKGNIVALLDDDSIALPGWLSALEMSYADPEIGAVGGRVLPKIGVMNENDLKRTHAPIGLLSSDGFIMSNLFLDPGEKREVDILRGCNMSVRRYLLEKIDYFDPRFRGQNCRVEDDVCLWVRRMGYKVIFNPEAVVRHLAEPRPDIPRSEFSKRSEFYVWRNTVWLYLKHFSMNPKRIFTVAVVRPASTCLRRVWGGSFKSPKLGFESFKYLPAACAGIWGGIWGVLISFIYSIKDSVLRRKVLRLAKFGQGELKPFGDSSFDEYSFN